MPGKKKVASATFGYAYILEDRRLVQPGNIAGNCGDFAVTETRSHTAHGLGIAVIGTTAGIAVRGCTIRFQLCRHIVRMLAAEMGEASRRVTRSRG